MSVRMIIKVMCVTTYTCICDQDEGDEDECGECEHDKGDVCDKDEDGGILMVMKVKVMMEIKRMRVRMMVMRLKMRVKVVYKDM